MLHHTTHSTTPLPHRNVILASVANAYNAGVDKRKQLLAHIRNEDLSEAFRHMDPNGTGRIDRDTVMALFLILNLGMEVLVVAGDHQARTQCGRECSPTHGSHVDSSFSVFRLS